MFRNTTIGARLWFLTVVTNSLLMIVGAVGWLGMSRSNEATRQIYQQQLKAAVDTAEARSNQLLVRVLLDGPPSPPTRRRARPRGGRARLRAPVGGRLESLSGAAALARGGARHRRGFRPAGGAVHTRRGAHDRGAACGRPRHGDALRAGYHPQARYCFHRGQQRPESVAGSERSRGVRALAAALRPSAGAGRRRAVARAGLQHRGGLAPAAIDRCGRSISPSAASRRSPRATCAKSARRCTAPMSMHATKPAACWACLAACSPAGRHGERGTWRRRCDCQRQPADRLGQHRPFAAHGATSSLAGGNRLEHGGADRHRAPERGQRARGQGARDRRHRHGRAGQRGGVARGAHHAVDRCQLGQDRRHHRGDREDRVPDQYPRPERGGRGGACRRARPRLRRGRRRCARLAQRCAAASRRSAR